MEDCPQAATKADFPEIAELYGKVFAGQSYFDFHDRYLRYIEKDPYFKPERARIIKKDGRIVSHVGIVEKYYRIGSTPVKTGGIADVCTHPHYRGRRYTAALMEDSKEYMRAHGFPLSFLHGIPGFYHKFGYIESVYSQFEQQSPLANLPSKESSSRVRAFHSKDLPRVNRLFNKAFNSKTMSVQRTEKSWYNIDLKNCAYVVENKKEDMTGYFLLSSPLRKTKNHFYVKEVVTFEESAAVAVTAFLEKQAQKKNLGEICIHQRPDTAYIEYLGDFGMEQKTVFPFEGQGGGMLCILNLESLFEQLQEEWSQRYRRANGPGAGIHLQFKTEIGNVSILSTRNGVKVNSQKQPITETVKCSQTSLVRLLVGYWKVEQFLSHLQKTNYSKQTVELLKILFPPDYPYSAEPDFF